MIPATICEYCPLPAEYVDSIPDARVPGTHPGECGYRVVELCWVCAMQRRAVATSRVKLMEVKEHG